MRAKYTVYAQLKVYWSTLPVPFIRTRTYKRTNFSFEGYRDNKTRLDVQELISEVNIREDIALSL